MLQINIRNTSNNPLPQYASGHAAGMDICACLDASLTLNPGDRVLIPTGLSVEIPVGFEAQIRPRSGLALKHGITVLNSPGTIDADYRGEIKIILINLGQDAFEINNGDRIAQMVIAAHAQVSWTIQAHLSETTRGIGGFGHTGK
jgi:dUTP pyrophosphatase